jgi:hypothetical protein
MAMTALDPEERVKRLGSSAKIGHIGSYWIR